MSKINSHGVVMIVCHDSMAGPPHHTLRDFMLRRGCKALLFVGHQNRYVINNPVESSYFELYKHGVLAEKGRATPVVLPEWAAYIRDFILTFWWWMKYVHAPVDEFIGLGNLNAFAGLILRVFGLANTIVYYVIDYIPQRFSNVIMNTLYHWIDYVCARFSSMTWNYAGGMIEARNQKWGFDFPRQIVVPNGITFNPNVIKSIGIAHKSELVYMGTLYEQQGVQVVIQALPQIAKAIGSVTLTIIGIGPYKKNLVDLAKKLNVTKRVNFLGYFPDAHEMEQRLASASLGMAIYKPDVGFVRYTEPGKVKRYLACGVPVVMTDISHLAGQIADFNCGVVVKYSAQDLSRTVVRLLQDTKKMSYFRKQAVVFAKHFDWSVIFTTAFAHTDAQKII